MFAESALDLEEPILVPDGNDRRRKSPFLFILGYAATAYLIMPVVYALAAFHGPLPILGRASIEAHILFNCTTNLAVMLTARDLRGRLDSRLTALFSRVMFFHGILGFSTLVLRTYYSIPMLLVGVGMSVVLGLIVVMVTARSRRPRIGVLGPWHPMLGSVRRPWEIVDHPDADVRRYDLFLTTFVQGLAPEWTPTLSRALLGGKRVAHAATFLEEASGVVSIDHFHIDHLPEGGVASYRVGKRLLELLVLALAAIPALLVLAAGALLVGICMGRPIFFVQPRVGQGGRIFNIYKLRTMCAPTAVDADRATSRLDRRITPVGRWLRRFHVDELPQLWNVLTGDMSLVGPRPEQPSLAETYRRQVPAFAYREMVAPGITGWAQVRAGYAADVEETKVKLGYDLFYLKNFSFALDLQILARTFVTLLVGGGVR